MIFKRENSQKLFKREIRQSFNHLPFEVAVKRKRYYMVYSTFHNVVIPISHQ